MNAGLPNGTIARFQAVIDEFRHLRAETTRLPRMEQVVAEFSALVSQRVPRFNAFEVLRVGADEVVHSGVLAWLLDASAGHGQGPLFLNLLADALNLPLSVGYGDRYVVRRELSGLEAVIDVCVCRRGVFVIYIENKIWAAEGPQQVDREWRDLQRTAAANGVPVDGRYPIFLTRDGRQPVSGEASAWLCLSYPQLAKAFRPALRQFSSTKLASFLEDWIDSFSQWGIEP